MKIFAVGAPGPVGGACTELAHTIRLWRRFGAEVHVVPTWTMDDSFRPMLDELGVPVHRATKDTIRDVPGIEGAVTVGFCNQHYLDAIPALRSIGCKIVWAPCMTFFFQNELLTFRKHGCPDAMMFQSEYQRGLLEGQLRGFGYDRTRGHLIRGAFDWTDWPYQPRAHPPGGTFVLGKVARPDMDKWSSNLWSIYGRVQYRQRRALVMGLSPESAKKLGTLPEWAEWLRPNDRPVQKYLKEIHCMLTVNGGAAENWPRVGLECFAAGVPVVAQRDWGWREMVEDGTTGLLGSTDEELAHHAACLAYDEALRLRITRAARERLEAELAHPETLWSGWERLFQSVMG